MNQSKFDLTTFFLAQCFISRDGNGKTVNQKQQIFVDFLERPAEAPKKAYKIAVFGADLKWTARKATEKNIFNLTAHQGLFLL